MCRGAHESDVVILRQAGVVLVSDNVRDDA